MVQKHHKQKVGKEKLQREVFHDEDLVPVEQAANFLGMSTPFVKKWMGVKIPVYKIGTSTRFKIADLKAFLESCRVENQTG